MTKYASINRGQEEAIYNKLVKAGGCGEEILEEILSDEVVILIERRVKPQPQPKPPLLISLPKITVPETAKFDAAKHIKVDTSPKAKVKISYVDSSVKNDIDGLVEPAQPATDLYPHKTTRYARYSEMREDLGGDKIIRTTYGKIFKLTEQQPNGPDSDAGPLFTDGRANLFEVEVNGGRRLVDVSWSDGGWEWYSYPVGYSRGWGGDRRVFSGNSRPVAA